MWERIENIFGLIFIILFIGMCSYGACDSDNRAKETYNNTHKFIVVNKDYREIGIGAFDREYSFMIKIDRYDINGVKIDCWDKFNWIPVTEYEYNNVSVGETYERNHIDIMTYGNY